MSQYRPRLHSPPSEDQPETQVFRALRLFVARALGLQESDVGSWEVQPTQRDLSLALYAYKGKLTKRPRAFGTSDSFVAQLFIRSGTSPIGENEMYAYRLRLITALSEFTHPAITGITPDDWNFDTGKNGSNFVNTLEVTGSIGFCTRPILLRNDAELLQADVDPFTVRQDHD